MAQNIATRWFVRHTFLAKAIGMFAGAAALIVFVTVPFFKNIREMSSKISEKRKENAELANKVSILSSLDGTVLNERVQILDKALPAKKDVVLYLSAIDGLSRELDLNFGGISLEPGEVTDASESGNRNASVLNESGLHTLSTEIEITGSQENIYAFLRSIEESVPLMQITDVKVNENNGTFHLGLKLGMLYAITNVKDVKGPISLFDEKEEQYFQDLGKFRSFQALSDINVEDNDLGKSNLFEGIKPQP